MARSIEQIMKDRPDLKKEEEVQELMDYCRELEDAIFDIGNKGPSDNEVAMKQFIREVEKDCGEILKKEEESDEESDQKSYIRNLKNNIEQFRKDNSI